MTSLERVRQQQMLCVRRWRAAVRNHLYTRASPGIRCNRYNGGRVCLHIVRGCERGLAVSRTCRHVGNERRVPPSAGTGEGARGCLARCPKACCLPPPRGTWPAPCSCRASTARCGRGRVPAKPTDSAAPGAPRFSSCAPARGKNSGAT